MDLRQIKLIGVLVAILSLIVLSIILNKHFMPMLSKKASYTLKIIVILMMIGSIFITYFTIFFKDFNKEYGWNVEYINYEKIQNYSTGKSQVIVLIDSGISKSQENQVIENINLTKDISNYDTNGHGTMMLSILKGYKSKIKGIAPDVKVISIKTMDQSGKSSSENLLKALEIAYQRNNISIINLSLGSYLEDENIKKMINKIIEKGITVVASTGDYGTDKMLFPASMDNVISVGALSANNKPWDYTNGLEICDILAPGDEIKSLELNSNIELTSGTSQSSILISGYISLLKDYGQKNNIKVSNIEIINILNKINAKKITYFNGFSELKKSDLK
ncbi:MAG: peptidase S8 and S53 subtilisin kexin sedolisin [Fusobacteria bacterium]|nr:MAG: peptidase S8 and S53 subtilisin kexin sedolisin [Fusobacteriota bacterium]KAF0229001.1 MAG: peptidase S8 and S53 subtilisin kexin [Fusobacteriota bacterium]